jgi:hypothetical protein
MSPPYGIREFYYTDENNQKQSVQIKKNLTDAALVSITYNASEFAPKTRVLVYLSEDKKTGWLDTEKSLQNFMKNKKV